MLAVAALENSIAAFKRKHDDRNTAKLRIALNLTKYVVTVHAWHVHVEDDQMRLWRAFVRTYPMKKVKSLPPARSVMASMWEAEFLNYKLEQASLGVIVIDD
jgi:hypothetical protein